MRHIAALLVLTVLSGIAQAQPFPNRPIRLVVGFPPGGGADIMARLMQSKLQEYLGQPVLVENKPGASTNIANEFVAKSAPDGHTLLVNTAALAINASLFRNLPFDVLRDFAPVSIISESPNVLVVGAKTPYASAKGLVEAARAAPGRLNYSSAGVGTTQHLAGELFKLRTRSFIVHIPYRGSSPSLAALIAGEVDFQFANIPAIHGHVKSGRLRPLAIAAPARDPQLPDVPTMKEAGIDGVEVSVWYAVFAPSATPKEVVQKLGEAVQRASRDPEIRKRLLDQGANPVGNSPEEFGRIMREEVARWAEVIKVSGASAD